MSTAERALIDIAQDRRYWIIHSITIPSLLLVELYLCCLALCTIYLGSKFKILVFFITPNGCDTGPEGVRSRKRKVAQFGQNAPAQNDLNCIKNGQNCTYVYAHVHVHACAH